jgi:outer membrane receptor protein involved in Fe transport
MRILTLRGVGVLLGAALPLSVLAEAVSGDGDTKPTASSDTLEEVVITAEHRVADVQKTAASITVRNGATLATEGKFSLGQILEDVPGVTGGAAQTPGGGSFSAGTDSVASGLTIRGIQSNAPVSGTVTSVAPAAAVYVDGVYSGVGGSYDIDRVEVLRGPQGTLYGRSATSGLVAIHTVDPALDNIGGNALAEVGNYSLQHYAAALNVPLVDDVLAVRVSGNRYQRDGYYADEGLGGGVDSTDGRVKVLFKPTMNVSVLLGAALENNIPQNTARATLSAPNTIAFPGGKYGDGYDNSRQYWGQLDWNLGFGTLTYLPAFRTWTSQGLNQVPYAGYQLNDVVNIPSDHFTTQELRLASNASSKLTWQIGAFYYLNTLSDSIVASLSQLPGGPPAPPVSLLYNRRTIDKETYALGEFGELTFSPVDDWRITAGARYDYTKVQENLDYQAPTLPPSPSGILTTTLSGSAGRRTFNNLNYKVRVEHDLTSSSLMYASVSTGFSPGDVSITTGATGNPELVDLKAETLTSYEVGSKNRFLSDRLQINGDVYFLRYGGYQALNNAIMLLGPGGAPELEVVPMMSPAQVAGAEAEIIFQLTSNDRVGFDAAETNAYWVGKPRNPEFASYYWLNGIPGVIPFTANLSYDHSIALPWGSKLMLRGDVRYQSPHDDTNVSLTDLQAGDYPYIRTPGEVIGDVNATWLLEDGKFSVTGYVRNVGDNRYKTAVTLLPNGVSPYDPRTYGVVLAVRF